MSECERIIKEGILPETFFEPELRCEFYVDETRKKIWAIELDLYLELMRVCKKYDLTIWADGGTLLGAVRHNGFIPWDDDMDLIMPRSDYDILMDLGPKEFSTPYFLQNPHTDKQYGYSFAKLRNVNTACIPRVLSKAGFCHGIHIDIFPLDIITIDTYERDRQEIKEHIMRCSSYMKRNNVNCLNKEQRENYYRYQTDSPQKEYDAIQAICKRHINEQSDYVANCTITTLNPKKQIWKKCWYRDSVLHQFESIGIPIPIDFESRLKTQYGEYMKLPPINERGLWHSGVFWDPDRMYVMYNV